MIFSRSWFSILAAMFVVAAFSAQGCKRNDVRDEESVAPAPESSEPALAENSRPAPSSEASETPGGASEPRVNDSLTPEVIESALANAAEYESWPDNREMALTIIKRALEAHGGEESFRGLTDSKVFLDVDFKGQDGSQLHGRVNEYFSAPNRYKYSLSHVPDDLSLMQGFDGTNGWAFRTATRVTTIFREESVEYRRDREFILKRLELRKLFLLVGLLEAYESGRPIAYLGTAPYLTMLQTVDIGKEVYMIAEGTMPSLHVFCFSAETNLLVRAYMYNFPAFDGPRPQNDELNVVVEFDGHKEYRSGSSHDGNLRMIMPQTVRGMYLTRDSSIRGVQAFEARIRENGEAFWFNQGNNESFGPPNE
ncbi:MAG: hypothetical protein NUW37_06620 [Planctomycetes bacterium]|nr:hypothetical protein [Planctomycetota bacterium]